MSDDLRAKHIRHEAGKTTMWWLFDCRGFLDEVELIDHTIPHTNIKLKHINAAGAWITEARVPSWRKMASMFGGVIGVLGINEIGAYIEKFTYNHKLREGIADPSQSYNQLQNNFLDEYSLRLLNAYRNASQDFWNADLEMFDFIERNKYFIYEGICELSSIWDDSITIQDIDQRLGTIFANCEFRSGHNNRTSEYTELKTELAYQYACSHLINLENPQTNFPELISVPRHLFQINSGWFERITNSERCAILMVCEVFKTNINLNSVNLNSVIRRQAIMKPEEFQDELYTSQNSALEWLESNRRTIRDLMSALMDNIPEPPYWITRRKIERIWREKGLLPDPG